MVHFLYAKYTALAWSPLNVGVVVSAILHGFSYMIALIYLDLMNPNNTQIVDGQKNESTRVPFMGYGAESETLEGRDGLYWTFLILFSIAYFAI